MMKLLLTGIVSVEFLNATVRISNAVEAAAVLVNVIPKTAGPANIVIFPVCPAGTIWSKRGDVSGYREFNSTAICDELRLSVYGYEFSSESITVPFTELMLLARLLPTRLPPTALATSKVAPDWLEVVTPSAVIWLGKRPYIAPSKLNVVDVVEAPQLVGAAIPLTGIALTDPE